MIKSIYSVIDEVSSNEALKLTISEEDITGTENINELKVIN